MRSIIEGKHFAASVDALGGPRVIDEVLDPVIDALMRDPYAFPKFENDWTSFRYIRTKGVGGWVPSLIFVFVIDEMKNVILEWVDEIDDAEITDSSAP